MSRANTEQGYCKRKGDDFECIVCGQLETRPAYCWSCATSMRDAKFACRLCGLSCDTDMHGICLRAAQKLLKFDATSYDAITAPAKPYDGPDSDEG